MSKIQQAISKISNLKSDNVPEQNEKDTMLETIEQARIEMNQAKSFFDFVSEPEQVDQAIYALNAAEKKYMFFLKRARNAGYKVDA
ncbi:DUF2508 family protein [Candidatus Contubernalis alkaliaceticus]|uniref:DUF2508 family protein n=1 Tax=Candidatus Contubernalis alkaliaceticus TaxID=338645 RepID=UPI001F4C51ED|nr:DUF2508 family protein [Candidatus Contubernalis alkalaceticus]UNC90658.1 YaaL family protein [Candidatus Contubernalis alkalaceticus]